MSKNVLKTTYITDSGNVFKKDAGAWDFVYEVSTVKSERWNIGDEVVVPGGREFVYAKSSAECKTGQACEFTALGYTAYTALGVSAAKGARSITIAAATHAALTKDELQGGYVVIYNDAESTGMFRGIVGNAAAAANAAFVIYLDAPLSAALVAATAATETYQNPYAALRTGTEYSYSKAGVPAAYVSGANEYFWVQKKGPCWLSPQTSNVGENGGRGCFFRHDGSLEGAEVALAVTVPAADTSQYAGFCLEGSQAGNGPLFMLNG